MAFLDFHQIKEDNPIESVIDKLELKLTRRGKQYRGTCPSCNGSERALVVTPEKGFYCFDAKSGGDVLQLVAHINGCDVKEAAMWLSEAEPEEKKKAAPSEGFKPLDYPEADHEAVIALGFETQDAVRIGIGYAKRGLMRGNIAIPVRLSDGKLIGYVGVQEAVLPNSWHF